MLGILTRLCPRTPNGSLCFPVCCCPLSCGSSLAAAGGPRAGASAHRGSLFCYISWCSGKMRTNLWMHKVFLDLKRRCRFCNTKWERLQGGWLNKCLLGHLWKKRQSVSAEQGECPHLPFSFEICLSAFSVSLSRSAKKGHLCLQVCF